MPFISGGKPWRTRQQNCEEEETNPLCHSTWHWFFSSLVPEVKQEPVPIAKQLPPTLIKAALQKHKLLSDNVFRRIPMVKVLRWNSHRKTVRHTTKNGMYEPLWRRGATSQSCKVHASGSKCSWTAGISSYATCHRKCISSGRLQDHSVASNYWFLAPVT